MMFCLLCISVIEIMSIEYNNLYTVQLNYKKRKWIKSYASSDFYYLAIVKYEVISHSSPIISTFFILSSFELLLHTIVHSLGECEIWHDIFGHLINFRFISHISGAQINNFSHKLFGLCINLCNHISKLLIKTNFTYIKQVVEVRTQKL